MLGDILLYVGSAAVVVWGVIHITKTRPVVAGFEPLSQDNRLVLTMEWIMEGLTLCFIGGLVSAVTLLSAVGPVTLVVYRGSALMLFVMAGVSLFTGARASPLPYRLCPAIFGSTALLFVVGSIV